MVRLLVEQGGPDVNEVWFEGYTALSWAAHSGQVDVVRYLIEKEANVDSLPYTRARDMITLLVAAASQGHLKL